MDKVSASLLLAESKDAHGRSLTRSESVESNAGVVLSAAVATTVAIAFSKALTGLRFNSDGSALLLIALIFSVVSGLLAGWAFLSSPPVWGPGLKSVKRAAAEDSPEEFGASLTDFYIDAERENSSFLEQRLVVGLAALAFLLLSVSAVAIAAVVGLGGV